MIIARGSDEGEEMLILGLSAENVRRLQAGKPMYLTSKTHGDGIPAGWRIMIFTGKDELAMAEQIKPFCTPETKIQKDPRL